MNSPFSPLNSPQRVIDEEAILDEEIHQLELDSLQYSLSENKALLKKLKSSVVKQPAKIKEVNATIKSLKNKIRSMEF
jgi:septal ring factor EnvC (AmiA/AmiB activator)